MLVKYSTEELSSPEGTHLVPHAKLRLEKNGKSAPPRKVEVNNMVSRRLLSYGHLFA
jgi:hypothetical protein